MNLPYMEQVTLAVMHVNFFYEEEEGVIGICSFSDLGTCYPELYVHAY